MKNVNHPDSVNRRPSSVVFLPNIITSLNLIFGCCAIVFVLQPGLVPSYVQQGDSLLADVNNNGAQFINLPQQIFLSSLFIALAALADFADGFVARLFKADSSLGKELDSLCDVVSFGVAPGMIVYQFLRLSYAQQEDGLDISFIYLLPAFIIPAAGAYRLARFNIDTEQAYGFKGLPIPAAGLFIASFPLIYWTSGQAWVTRLLINQWFWYGIIALVSWLMVSRLPMMAFKFSSFSIKKIFPFIILAVIAVAGAFITGWLCVPLVFIAYVLLSLLPKQKNV